MPNHRPPSRTDSAHADSIPTPMGAAQIWALIPCAGMGSRALGTDRSGDSAPARPKQYQPLLGQPLVMHTLAAFASSIRVARTMVVVAPGDTFFNAIRLPNASFLIASCGGNTRACSVLNGLTALADHGAHDSDWVLVHDAARCLITPHLIDALIEACLPDAVGGLLALPVPDTLKSAVNGRVATTLDRSDKWLAQTPQMFRLGTLRLALQRAGPQVTDEASAIEALGQSPRLVVSTAENFKVTYPSDFALAEAVLTSRGRRLVGLQ